jgi:hypothetical protein
MRKLNRISRLAPPHSPSEGEPGQAAPAAAAKREAQTPSEKDSESLSFRIPGQSFSFGPRSLDCRGWLQKFSIGKSSLFKFNNWKRRFFVLAVLGDQINLGYYEDETCHKTVGVVKLNPSDTRLVAHPSTSTHRKAKKPGLDIVIVFHELISGARQELRLVLRCDSTTDHRMWVSALREVIAVCDDPKDIPLE